MSCYLTRPLKNKIEQLGKENKFARQPGSFYIC